MTTDLLNQLVHLDQAKLARAIIALTGLPDLQPVLRNALATHFRKCNRHMVDGPRTCELCCLGPCAYDEGPAVFTLEKSRWSASEGWLFWTVEREGTDASELADYAHREIERVATGVKFRIIRELYRVKG